MSETPQTCIGTNREGGVALFSSFRCSGCLWGSVPRTEGGCWFLLCSGMNSLLLSPEARCMLPCGVCVLMWCALPCGECRLIWGTPPCAECGLMWSTLPCGEWGLICWGRGGNCWPPGNIDIGSKPAGPANWGNTRGCDIQFNFNWFQYNLYIVQHDTRTQVNRGGFV